MKLVTLLRLIDPIEDVTIWTVRPNGQYDEEDKPAFSGSVMDVPFYLLDCPVYTNPTDDIYIHTNATIRQAVTHVEVIITVIEE